MMERLIATEEKGNKEKRDTCKSALEDINRSNKKCPIVIQKMTFNIFSDYIPNKKSKKLRWYFSSTIYDVVQNYLAHLYHMISKTTEKYV